MRFVHFKNITYILSLVLIFEALAILLCLPVAWFYNEPTTPFYGAAFFDALIGMGLFLTSKRRFVDIESHKEAYILVTVSWIVFIAGGMLPYFFSHTIANPVDVIFETTSGLTTAGSSILSDIEALPKSILFWRSMTHWLGGIGIIVLVIVVLPSLNMGGYKLFMLESSLQEKIVPRFKMVAQRVLLIYMTLTFLQTAMLMSGGMNLFESLCHAFGTVATGGFSPKNDSIASYSIYIQYVMTLFMILSGANYVFFYHLVTGNKKLAFRNEEVRFYIFIILGVSLTIGAILYFQLSKPIELAFRESIFQVSSIITCSGFATADYLLWPKYAWILLFLLMFIGGCTGSTAGGIKMSRLLIVLRSLNHAFKKMVSPNAVIPLKYNDKSLEETEVLSIFSFIVVYVMVFVVGTIALVCTGVDVATSAGSAITALTTIGPGLGSTGPVANFAHLPDLAKLILSFLMFLGRLELYTVLIVFAPWFWKHK